MVALLYWLLKLNALVELHASVLPANTCFTATSLIVSLRIQTASNTFHHYDSMLLELCKFYWICHTVHYYHIRKFVLNKRVSYPANSWNFLLIFLISFNSTSDLLNVAGIARFEIYSSIFFFRFYFASYVHTDLDLLQHPQTSDKILNFRFLVVVTLILLR